MIDHACGLRWESTGGIQPTKGRELECPELKKALAKQTRFSKEEWDKFRISNLRYDHFIQSGNAYFRPADPSQLISDDAPKHYYIKIDDKYFQVSAVTSAHQAARNLVPTVSYSGEGALTVCRCHSICVRARVFAHRPGARYDIVLLVREMLHGVDTTCPDMQTSV